MGPKLPDMAASPEEDKLSVTSSDLGSSFGCEGDLGSPSDPDIASPRDVLNVIAGEDCEKSTGGSAMTLDSLDGSVDPQQARVPAGNARDHISDAKCEEPLSKFERTRTKFLEAEQMSGSASLSNADTPESIKRRPFKISRSLDFTKKRERPVYGRTTCVSEYMPASGYHTPWRHEDAKREKDTFYLYGGRDSADRASSERSSGMSARSEQTSEFRPPQNLSHQDTSPSPINRVDTFVWERRLPLTDLPSPSRSGFEERSDDKTLKLKKSMSVPASPSGYLEQRRFLSVPRGGFGRRSSAEFPSGTPPPVPLRPPRSTPPRLQPEHSQTRIPGDLSRMSMSKDMLIRETSTGISQDSPHRCVTRDIIQTSICRDPTHARNYRELSSKWSSLDNAAQRACGVPTRTTSHRDVPQSISRSSSSSPADLGLLLRKSPGRTSDHECCQATSSSSHSRTPSPNGSMPRNPWKSSGQELRRVSSVSETASLSACSSSGVPPSSKETVTSRMRYVKNHQDHGRSLDSAGSYLTPSQRKELMVKDLKIHVKQLERLVEDKEREIDHLRMVMDAERDELHSSFQRQIKEAHSLAAMSQEEVTSLQGSHEESVKTVASLQQELDELKDKMAEKEAQAEQIYLEMYNKGRESAIFEREEELELLKALEKRDPKIKATITDLRNKLTRTQAELAKWQTIQRYEAYHTAPRPVTEAETTLAFLKDSVYHFFTGGGKASDDHLRAIVRMLRFSEVEKRKIAEAVVDRRNRTATGRT